MKSETKTILCFLFLFLFSPGLAQSSLADQKILAVPLRVQEQDQWCWAGSSSAVLKYYTKIINQCYIADFGWTRNDCCTTPGNCNAPNGMYGTSGSIQGILSHWCVSSNGLANALTFAGCRTEIDANHPFIIRYGWDAGGGHFIVGRGYKTIPVNMLYLMNPWPGEGYGVFTYKYVKRKTGDHTWTHTLNGIQRDLHVSDWKAAVTVPVFDGGYWKYVLSLKEIRNGCGKLLKFYHDFYDENGVFYYRQYNTAADFPGWFNDCADADTQFPRKTKFCGEAWTWLGGRTSGSVRHSFVIKCDSGSTITRRVKVFLTGGAGHRQQSKKDSRCPPWVPAIMSVAP